MQGTHQGKSPRLWIATVVSSLLYAAAHPPFSWWPLALVAVAPVSAVLLDRRSPVPWPRAAAAGFLFGTLATYFLVGPWAWPAAREFFVDSALEAMGFTLLLPVIASGVALVYAAAFAVASRLGGLGAAVGVIASAAVWACAELARTSLGYGNPWGAFAAALIAADDAVAGAGSPTTVSDILALGGPVLVAFAAAASGAALGLAWVERRSATARGRALAAGATVLGLVIAISQVVASRLPARDEGVMPARTLRVALVQPGLGRSQLWEKAGAAESFERNVEMTRSPEAGGADLVVWPENALPFLLDANVDKRERLRELARERGAALLVGGSRSVPGRGGRVKVFNSAFLFPADGGEPAVYDKRLLLPFIERVPWWVSPFLSSPWQGTFSPGSSGGGDEEDRDSATPDLFTVKGWRIAPLLCFEAIYPSVTASRAAAGADLLVNLSNDSWFDAGAGTEQHFSLARLAAAETRRPMVRVATTGVSGLVAEDGLVSWRLPTRAGAIARIDLVAPRHDSLFVRGGRVGVNLFVVLLALAAVLLPGRFAGPKRD